MTDKVIETDIEQPEIEQLPDGIYINLDEDHYHAQRRLSSSGISAMMCSEADFWVKSWMNSERNDDPTDAQLLGRAFHAARLEPDTFEEKYIRQIDKDDFPDALVTDADVRAQIKEIAPKKEDFPDALSKDAEVKAALKELGQPQTVGGETVDDRKERLRKSSAGVVFFDDIVTEWEAENGSLDAPDNETPLQRAQRLLSYGYDGKIWSVEKYRFENSLDGRTPLPRNFWEQIKSDIAEMSGSTIAEKYLSGGIAEVSILWTDPASGVALKCRIDYLTADNFTDVKTFENVSRKNVRQCIEDAFRYNRYYIQARFYWEGIEAARLDLDLQVIDAITGEQTASPVIDAIRQRDSGVRCTYVFQQKRGVPNVFACPVLLSQTHASIDAAATGDKSVDDRVRDRYAEKTLMCLRAEHEIAEAIDRFSKCMDIYGENEKWRPLDPEFSISDASFNGFWLEGEWA